MHLRSSVAPNCRPTQAERISASTDSVPCARCAVSRFLFLRIALHCSASHRIASHRITSLYMARQESALHIHTLRFPGLAPVQGKAYGFDTLLTLQSFSQWLSFRLYHKHHTNTIVFMGVAINMDIILSKIQKHTNTSILNHLWHCSLVYGDGVVIVNVTGSF
jgi:hypothetical protein